MRHSVEPITSKYVFLSILRDRSHEYGENLLNTATKAELDTVEKCIKNNSS